MYPPSFEYERAATVEHAVQVLAAHPGAVSVLAGGCSLVPSMKQRLVRPPRLVDIGRLASLRSVERTDGHLRIGALVRHAEAARHATPAALPILADVGTRIADPQVRNMGTVGGAAAEIYPGGDWAPCLVALDARLRCRSASGTRTITADEQFAQPDRVALRGDELLEFVEIPLPAPRSGSAHVRLERRAGFGVVACSAQVQLGEDGTVTAARIALSGLRDGPVRAAGAEAALTGTTPDAAVLEEVAATVRGLEATTADVRGSAPYRQKVAGTVARRAVVAALERAGGRSADGTTHGEA